MGIQAGINRVISLAGTIGAIQEKLKKDTEAKTANTKITDTKTKATKKKTTKKTTTSTKASKKVATRNEEIQRSREFAKMITEGVPNLSFNPNEYVPPERKEK